MSSRSGGNGGGGNISSVFYADSYHPIQSGSIDGTDTLPHDNGVYRALLCSQAGLYDAFGDPKVAGDPYCIVFVGHLSHLTTEETIHKVMSKYGKVKSLRLVRHIVTGASRGYAFVEFETEREMRRAYEEAHHTVIDDSKITVDYNRQQLMSGWIPRRLGGGLGGRKESGQLRFGGRERPFRAPLRPIPVEELKRLGISPPPEGRYMSRFQVPSPPRRKSVVGDEHKQHSSSRHDNEEKTYHRSRDEEKTYQRSRDEEKTYQRSHDEVKTYQRSHDEEKTYQRSHDEHKQHSSSRHDNEEKTYQRSHDEKEHYGGRKHKHYKRSHDETSRSRSRSKRRSISQARHSSSD